ncbi:hypothetical protein DFR50_107125 [Roseiarcus fermentans]|uniref:Major tropism determinant N-terminal domain-containing protein n=1 Tax=Roseiarcus fermentans TaxID=1473586 RepID=A0A366FQ52_9HYPH|nr:hypothetical protein [Roseiarcus fermentans]RBP15855.1 hypothetical protein DFR50_107125 [Roseiarcus fermentans]
MSEQLQLRRGTAAQIAAFTGAQGEVVVDTTNNRLVLQDGATAGGYAAAKLSEVVANTRTSIADASYAATATDRTIAYVALTAARAVALPAASAYPTGTRLLVVDESGACSSSATLTLNANGSDRINGAASFVIASPYGCAAIESNGANAWTIVDQFAPGSLTTIAQGPFGASFQCGVLETLVTLSGASTTAPTPIPANCIVTAVGARTVTAVTGAPSFQVGVSGNAGLFGSGLNVAAGSINFGLIGPNPYYSATPLIVTATSGAFTGGAVRLSIHYLSMGPSTW